MWLCGMVYSTRGIIIGVYVCLFESHNCIRGPLLFVKQKCTRSVKGVFMGVFRVFWCQQKVVS